jgi:hypothetical protein
MIKYICDGCGKEENGVFYPAALKVFKPEKWFERADKDGEQHACCRDCVEKIAEKTKKTSVVLPI